jgi:hypothetical protein
MGDYPRLTNWYIKRSPLIGEIVTIYYDKLHEFPLKHYQFTDVRAKYLGDRKFSIEKLVRLENKEDKEGEPTVKQVWSAPMDLSKFKMDKLFEKRIRFEAA